mmetsp:Transcript_30648/g.71615  ORF Transcript_30648/g.71615 Transcript_30648/m.71615 type:complete len:205 (-) Transcript_30648:27-641(-)
MQSALLLHTSGPSGRCSLSHWWRSCSESLLLASAILLALRRQQRRLPRSIRLFGGGGPRGDARGLDVWSQAGGGDPCLGSQARWTTTREKAISLRADVVRCAVCAGIKVIERQAAVHARRGRICVGSIESTESPQYLQTRSWARLSVELQREVLQAHPGEQRLRHFNFTGRASAKHCRGAEQSARLRAVLHESVKGRCAATHID